MATPRKSSLKADEVKDEGEGTQDLDVKNSPEVVPFFGDLAWFESVDFPVGSDVVYLGKDGKPCDKGKVLRDLGPYVEVHLTTSDTVRQLIRERVVRK